MGLVNILTWPIRTVGRVVSFFIQLCLSIVTFPFKLANKIFKSLRERVCYMLDWSDNKIKFIRSKKPFVYIFPPPLIDDDPDTKLEPDDTESVDGSQSISTLIQELIALSQPDVVQKQSQDAPGDKIHQLIQELQELASSDNIETEEEEEGGVSSLLADLGNLEHYLTQFLREQESACLVTDDRINSLETIIEETPSKESSPTIPSSPLPYRMKPSLQQTIIEEEKELTDSQNEISQTLMMLQKVTNSQELKDTLQQLAQLHKQNDSNEFETPPTSPDDVKGATPPSDSTRRNSMKEQLSASHDEMDNLIQSLDQQQQFIATQQELQCVMDSLNAQTLTNEITPPDQLVYDSLTPVYAKLDKKPHPPETLQLKNEEIYDSIPPMGGVPIDETPPPIPLRRTASDASTDSYDNSPKVPRRRYSSDDDEHSSRRHSKRRKNKHYHHCRCHSPERCCSHHRPRSRERHHHHHTRHRSTSNESPDDGGCGHCNYYRESGYESQPHELESPMLKRRDKRSYSEADNATTPTTPPTSKRGFFGLFGKKSTSLTSLSSNKSDIDKSSICSYKM